MGNKNQNLSVKKSVWGVGQIFAPLFVLFISLFSLYHIFYANRIIPGVKIAGINVGGQTYTQALETLAKANLHGSQALVLRHDDKAYTLPLGELGLSYNWSASVKSAYAYGRSKNVVKDTADKFRGLLGSLHVPAVYAFDASVLDIFLTDVTKELVQPAVNASFMLDSADKLTITPSSEGTSVDREALYNSIIGAMDSKKFETIKIPVDLDKPQLVWRDLERVTNEVEEIIFNTITINKSDDPEDNFDLTPLQKLTLLGYKKNTLGGVDIVIDIEELDKFTKYISSVVSKSPRGKVTEFTENRVISFEFIAEGTELNEEVFSASLSQALLDKKSVVATPLRKIGGTADPEKYGIVSLLGKGESSYKGSGAARAKNLQLATTRAGGVLVPPGGIYSLNDSVGDISAATGYDTAYVISNGRTVLGEGGGVCQVSTTIFRAVLNAGLPVVERHAHAYRVVYYEQDQPVGLDAAIYQPSLDFKFKNDTPNWLLLQTEYNEKTQELDYYIFGTPDGRTVDITEPQVTNVISAPAARYQDDPTLPKGVVNQVDFAASGATVEFSRKVTRNDEIIYEDTFKSVYRPWQAIFMVGTKEN